MKYKYVLRCKSDHDSFTKLSLKLKESTEINMQQNVIYMQSVNRFI